MEMIKGAPTVRVEVDGAPRQFILDTGSTISLVQPDVSASDVREATVAPIGVTGTPLRLKGEQMVEFDLQGHRFRHPFHRCSLPTEADGLVGTDLLIRQKARLDFDDMTYEVRRLGNQAEECECVRGEQPVAFTVFAGLEAPPNPNVPEESRETSGRGQDAVMMLRPDEIALRESDAWVVKLAATLKLAPRTKHLVKAWLDCPRQKPAPQLVCVEPARLPMEGVLVARALSRTTQKPPPPAAKRREKPQVTSQDSQLSRSSTRQYVHVLLTNFSKEVIVVPKSTGVGMAEEISEALVATINPEPSARVSRKVEINPEFREYLEEKLAHLSEEEKRVMEPVLLRYRGVFHDEERNDFRGTDVAEHRIITGDARPIRRPQYRTPYALREEMDRQVKDML
jgi:hypothetical protein